MDPPSTKKQKLEASEAATEPSVRQQLRDLLTEASIKHCGIPLPREISDVIVDNCLFSDFSELPKHVFVKKEYKILGSLDKILDYETDEDEENEEDQDDVTFKDLLRKAQLRAIMNHPDKPSRNWSRELHELIEYGYLGIWWLHVGFSVGWKGSGELMEFDLWMCREPHADEGVFVFEKGSTTVLLSPEKFCEGVRYPDRASELSELCASILWDTEFFAIRETTIEH